MVEAMTSAGAPPVSDVFGAIAHPIRRRIVTALASGDKAVHELAAPLAVTRPAVSQHLAVLRATGLVTEERSGRERRYRLRRAPLDDVRFWLATLDRFWGDGLARLAAQFEESSCATPGSPTNQPTTSPPGRASGPPRSS